jgi:nitroreductase
MNVFEAIAKRHSVRSFSDKPVERTKLESIFNAVRMAPSARNAQEWRFVLVTEPELREKVADAGGQPFLYRCPVIAVACALTDGRIMQCGEPAYLVDVAIAVDHLMLAAEAMGLGTCCVGMFDADAVRRELGIPPGVPVAALVAIGYADEEERPTTAKRRLSIEDILMDNRWGEPLR